MARNTSAIGSGGGKPKPKPKKNPAGFGATPATPKKAAAPNIGAAIERGAKRGRTPPKPTAPKRPGLGATPGRPTAKPTKKLRGLQRETYKSLPVKTRERLIRDQPKGSDISAGIHAERMRAQRAVRAADAYFTTREKKIDKGGRAAQQTLAEKDAPPTNAKDINRGTAIVRRQFRRQTVKDALSDIGKQGQSFKKLEKPQGKVERAGTDAVVRALGSFVPAAATAVPGAKNAPGKAVETAKNAAKVWNEDPEKQTKKMGTDAVAAGASIAGALVDTALHPVKSVKGAPGSGKKLAKGIVQDYKERYPASSAKQREVMRRGGLLPYALDATMVGGTGVGAAGRVANRAAAAGKMGKRLERVATERPRLRVSGGTSRPQEVHPNILRNLGRAGADAVRRKKTARGARKGDALSREAQADGEVVAILTRKQKERKGVPAVKGPGSYRTRAKQQRVERKMILDEKKGTGGARATRKREKKLRRAALYYAGQLGIRTPEQAREVLGEYRKRVEKNRAELPDDVKLRGDDNLPTIDALIADADKWFGDPEVGRAADALREDTRKAAAEDPGLGLTRSERAANALTRTYAPQAALLGIERRAAESQSEYLVRVAAAAKDAGLAQPAYLPSWSRGGLFRRGGSSDRAVGGFPNPIKRDKTYRGINFDLGTQDLLPGNARLQVMRNLKRSENWKMWREQFDRNAFKTLTDAKTGEKIPVAGVTYKELEDALHDAGVNPSSGEIVNVNAFEADLAAQLGKEVDNATTPNSPIIDEPRHDSVDLDVEKAWAAATSGGASSGGRGFYFLSHEAAAELKRDARASLTGLRRYDIVKGKISRVLLGNPAWASMQTVANAVQAAMFGMTPKDLALDAPRFFRKMEDNIGPAKQMDLEANTGIHKWFDPQPHLAEGEYGSITAFHRGLKETGFYQRLHKANPLDLFFRYDTAQNNAFRRGAVFRGLKREAYKDIEKDLGMLARWGQQLGDMVSLRSPTERMYQLAQNPEVVERVGQAVDDFFGNWNTYTARERRIAGRTFMFYGFIRFMTKLSLYTLPIKHPIRLAILLQLGNLERQELEAIFGTDVPPWEYGNVYTEDGKYRYPTQRANALMNAAQLDGATDIARLASPLVMFALTQYAGKDAMGDPWTLDGRTTRSPGDGNLLSEDRLQVLLGDFLRLNPGYRLSEKTGFDVLTGGLTGMAAGLPGIAAGVAAGALFPQKPLYGKQSADSSLIFPQPMKYKNEGGGGLPTVQSLLAPDKRASGYENNQRRIAQQKAERTADRWAYFLPLGTPVTPPAGGRRRIDDAKRFAQFKKDAGKKQTGIPTLSQLLKGK